MPGPAVGAYFDGCYLIFSDPINARCNGSNDFHFTDEELEALRGLNLSKGKRPNQDLNPGLSKSKALPTPVRAPL